MLHMRLFSLVCVEALWMIKLILAIDNILTETGQSDFWVNGFEIGLKHFLEMVLSEKD